MAWVEKHGRTWRVRFWKADNTPGSILGFTTEHAARIHAATIADHRTHHLTPEPTPVPPQPAPAPAPEPRPTATTAQQPGHAAMTFARWLEQWWDTIDVSDNTLAQYRSLAKNHLLPQWGDGELAAITPSAVATWVRTLQPAYKPTTATAIRKLFALICSDAVDEQLITANPVRKRSRGRDRTRYQPQEEKVWATEYEVRDIAGRVLTLAGTNQALLVITAAYTGMRWGELAGLRRERCHLTGQRPRLIIDPHLGALHEVNGQLEYGSPKTPASARTVTLPPFLAELLRDELTRHRHPQVFTSSGGHHLRRSCFGRRIWTRAVGGTTLADGTTWTPLKPGLTFHGLRHSHKTWMIEDRIPDVVQARRLGHRMDDKIDDVYSHVADTLEHQLLTALQTRWNRSLTTPSTQPTNDSGNSPAPHA